VTSERNNPNLWRNNPAIVLSVLALLVVTVVPILVSAAARSSAS
jgi:hypothetical protein